MDRATDATFETASNWDTGTYPSPAHQVSILESSNNPIYNTRLSTLEETTNTEDYITHLWIDPNATLTVAEKLWVYSKGGTPEVDGNYSGGNLVLEPGADMNFRRNLYWGVSDKPGSITVNGGVLNNKNAFIIGENGNGILTINDGAVSTEAGNLIVGGYVGYGTVNLNGGTLKPNPGIDIDARRDRAGAGHVTIDGGTLILINDLSAIIPDWIHHGKLKAVPGKKINFEVIPAVAEDPFASPPVAAAPAQTLVTAVATSPREVVYLTKSKTMGPGASEVNDDAIIRMLQTDPNFNVTVVQDPDSAIDLSGYDLVIAQETFGSSDAIWSGSLGVQNITVPTIFNKTYAWTNGESAISDTDAAVLESSALAITVDEAVRRADPLFSGIDFSEGNDIQIFKALTNDDGSEGGAKGFQILNNIDINQDPNGLGNSVGIGGTSATLHASILEDVITPTAALVFNELRRGTQIGENALDVLQAPVIAFSMNYGAIAAQNGANLTSEALTLWRNAAYHLTGQMSPSTLYMNPSLGVDKVGAVSKVTTKVEAVGNRIHVSNVQSTSEINIYSITGALVKSFKTNEDINFEFKSGLWIATVKTFEGTKSVKLLTK